MFKFFHRLFIFIFWASIMFCTYVVLFDGIIMPHSKSSLLNNKGHEIQVIITGTSHTLWGLDPSGFKMNTINIGEEAKPILVDLEFLIKNQYKLTKLKYIIIPIDYFTLFYSGENIKYSKRYWHHWGLKKEGMNIFHFVDCQIITPIELLNSNRLKLNNFNPRFGIYNSIENRLFMLNRIKSFHKDWMSLDNLSEINNRILEFIRFFNSKNINIIFVQMPIPISTQKQFKNKFTALTLKSISKFKTFSNTYFLNYNEYKIFKNDSLYADCDHLNNIGAKRATDILNKKITEISLKTSRN